MSEKRTTFRLDRIIVLLEKMAGVDPIPTPRAETAAPPTLTPEQWNTLNAARTLLSHAGSAGVPSGVIHISTTLLRDLIEIAGRA